MTKRPAKPIISNSASNKLYKKLKMNEKTFDYSFWAKSLTNPCMANAQDGSKG